MAEQAQRDAPVQILFCKKKNNQEGLVALLLAEKTGFEPAREFPLNTLSRRAP